MIFVNSEKDVAEAYIMEGLRRLWAASVDETGKSVSFDYYYNISPRKGRTVMIPYEDIYCPDDLQMNIVNELLAEPYCTPSGKIYKLNKSRYETKIRFNTVLGPSPWSSKKTFAEKHPKFNKIEKKFD